MKAGSKLKALVMGAIVATSVGCSSNNLEEVKAHAPEVWRAQGFEVMGYDGYQWGAWGVLGSDYGGALVWYRLRAVPDNGIRYGGALQRWGNEYHVYNLTAIDAISPGRK